MAVAQARLVAPDLPERVRRLGFRGADETDVLAAARRVLAEGRGAEVDRLASSVIAGIGSFLHPVGGAPADPWADRAADDQTYGQGVLPMLTLVATADEVVDFHRRRGLDERTAWASLADLGQQVWVHRQTFGVFGLHTQGWLLTAWSGSLLWLGRLQFELQRADAGPYAGGWQLSTHIPQSGPLTPEAVDDSFARAVEVFDRLHPEHRVRGFHCSSWLLDPQLAQVLPAESNLVRFQQRWSLFGPPRDGDEDVIFFVFRHRGPVELDALPQTTTLERAVVERLRSGEHWHVRDGVTGDLGRTPTTPEEAAGE